MSNPAATVDDRQIAAKHRAMWASGDYPKLAAELVRPWDPSWWKPPAWTG